MEKMVKDAGSQGISNLIPLKLIVKALSSNRNELTQDTTYKHMEFEITGVKLSKATCRETIDVMASKHFAMAQLNGSFFF